MKVTYKGDYALKVILYMSLNKNSLLHLEELSKSQDIPRKFLELILLELKRGGFINSKREGITLLKHLKK